jgi:hypothetical protein
LHWRINHIVSVVHGSQRDERITITTVRADVIGGRRQVDVDKRIWHRWRAVCVMIIVCFSIYYTFCVRVRYDYCHLIFDLSNEKK